MPKFVEEFIENYFWNDFYFEIQDFPSGFEEEILIPDTYVPENIVTM